MDSSGIINLTRKFVAPISSVSRINLESIRSMPEMVLDRMIKQGNKHILHVDMNHCGAAIIKSNGIHTVYTDALSGCNSVASIVKLKNGQTLMILSHYVPTNQQGQIEALAKQLKCYDIYIDKNSKPQLFFNIRGLQRPDGEVEAIPNQIIEKVEDLFKSVFKNGVESSITPYPTTGRKAFYSSANIFQFNPKNLSELKITNVGEKEQFITIK